LRRGQIFGVDGGDLPQLLNQTNRREPVLVRLPGDQPSGSP